ncbi:ferredoxin family protein [Oerskovia sp. KBS0722]|uniref:4Fe-4S dicluster domain-containing protein n=1 Tax=Oerskovia sp. KBS0722 TaxID=1179673 RepID=UPI00110E2705|nr:ferredoxin family protein [Oerskovia sp. KBS0722]QDW61603.1 ferredoxin family protein [Oerskovia sp. KBS0722]
MIEILNAARCTSCDICVRICPTNVFEPAPDGGVPTIARHSDCQTCFQCEAYCPEDAIFVSPSRTPEPAGSPFLDEADLLDRDLLGLYRDRVGWRRAPRGSSTGADAPAGSPAGAPVQVVLSSDVDYHRAAALAPTSGSPDHADGATPAGPPVDGARPDTTARTDSTTTHLQGAPS